MMDNGFNIRTGYEDIQLTITEMPMEPTPPTNNQTVNIEQPPNNLVQVMQIECGIHGTHNRWVTLDNNKSWFCIDCINEFLTKNIGTVNKV